MYTVCVFCGTASGHDAQFSAAARDVTQRLVQKGCRIVYGGGRLGLMGVVAEAALAAGGHVTGVVPTGLIDKEIMHRRLTVLHRVESIHARKKMMTQLADAFLILPGGYGTLDELFEVLTLQQLKVHDKPCGLLNVDGFFDALVAYLDHATACGFLLPAYRGMLAVESDAAVLLGRIGVV